MSRQGFGSYWRALRGTALEPSRWDPKIVCLLLEPVGRLKDFYSVASISRPLLPGPDKLQRPGFAQSMRRGTVRWARRVAPVAQDSVAQPEAVAAKPACPLG